MFDFRSKIRKYGQKTAKCDFHAEQRRQRYFPTLSCSTYTRFPYFLRSSYIVTYLEKECKEKTAKYRKMKTSIKRIENLSNIVL